MNRRIPHRVLTLHVVIAAIGFACFLGGNARADFNTSAYAQSKSEGKNTFFLGVDASTSFFLPSVQYQRSLGQNFSLGVTAFYTDTKQSNTEVKVDGGLITANYYSLPNMHGLWVQGGYGPFHYELHLGGQSEKFDNTGWIFTVGGKQKWLGRLELGIAAGALVLPQIQSKLLDIGLSGTVPVLQLNMGFTF